MMEAHPDALVVPTVLFTDRKKWRKTVPLELHTQINDRLFLHFEYVFHKLFDLNARDYYNVMFLHFEYVFHKLFDLNARDYYNINNPVVKILLPKMNYEKNERIEVIRQAYKGLFQLTTRGLFDKYIDFIDVYSEISGQEQDMLYESIIQHKETAMLAQYIKEKGRQEGIQEGRQKGRKEGRQEGRQHTVIEMVRNADKNGLPEDMIAQIVELDITLVRQILNNEPVEIPLD